MYYSYDVSRCFICSEKSTYILEWYGLNQYGEKPIVVREIGACSNFRHIVESAKIGYDDFGKMDGIVDYETLDREHPKLTDLVNEANQHGVHEEVLKKAQSLIDMELSPNQLLFSF